MNSASIPVMQDGRGETHLGDIAVLKTGHHAGID